MAAGSFHEVETHPYTAQDFRFTTKGDVLYAIGPAWPTSGEGVIHSLAPAVGTQAVESITLLGSDAKPRFEQRSDDLRVQLPGQPPAKYAYVLRVTFGGASD